MDEEVELPSFERPPVREVALALRFDPLPIQMAHYGLLWNRLRDRFPSVDQKPPLPPTPPEDLSREARGPQLQLTMTPTLPLPRFWLVSESGNEFCQVQNDRFVVNWRRVREGDVYPRYEHIRELFDTCLAQFLELLDEEQLGQPQVFQAEIDYINQLDRDAGWENLSDLSDVLSFWSGAFGEGRMPAPTQAGAGMQFLIPDQEDPRGRLYLDVRSARRDDNPVLNMTLRARVPLPGGTIQTALDAFDFGRAWIVRSFASTTTPAMHEIWGRER